MKNRMELPYCHQVQESYTYTGLNSLEWAAQRYETTL